MNSTFRPNQPCRPTLPAVVTNGRGDKPSSIVTSRLASTETDHVPANCDWNPACPDGTTKSTGALVSVARVRDLVAPPPNENVTERSRGKLFCSRRPRLARCATTG